MLFSTHAIVVLLSLLVYVSVTRIGHQRRAPSAALAWVLLLVAFPYVGLPVFLMFGTRKLLRPGQRAPRRFDPASNPLCGIPQTERAPIDIWAGELLASMGMPPPAVGGKVSFQAQGEEALQAVIDLIDQTRQQLRVATFLLGQDDQAERIVEALCRASARGVEVRLLLDAMGCLRVTAHQYEQLLAAGVWVRRYMPLLHNPVHGRANLRNHRKLLVADEQTVWAGGRNLAGEYFMGVGDEAAWLDLSFSIEGPLVAQAIEMFERDWRVGKRLPARYRRRAARYRGTALARVVEPMAQVADMPEQLIAQVLARTSSSASSSAISEPSKASARSEAVQVPDSAREPMSPDQVLLDGDEPSVMPSEGTASDARHAGDVSAPETPVGEEFVGEESVGEALLDARPLVTQLLPSGPDLFDDTLYSLLLTAAFHAERRLLAVTPYFVPDEALMTALMMAARRGVQISLLIPAHSNHRLADVARMRALRQLAQVGAHIHLYPRMLHAKVVVIDEAMALAGSLNLDSRSFFLNYEMMVAFYRKTEVRWLSDWLEAHIAEARPYRGRPASWWKDILEGMVRAVAYQL